MGMNKQVAVDDKIYEQEQKIEFSKQVFNSAQKEPTEVNVTELIEDPENKESYKCPQCGEYELRRVYIWNHNGEDDYDKTYTHEMSCDNPDCLANYAENVFGYLLKTN